MLSCNRDDNDYRMTKRQKAFSRLIFQPLQKAKNCFLLLYHCNRNRQIPFRNLLANQRFAVEILEFRLSIVVMMKFCLKKQKSYPPEMGRITPWCHPNCKIPKGYASQFPIRGKPSARRRMLGKRKAELTCLLAPTAGSLQGNFLHILPS